MSTRQAKWSSVIDPDGGTVLIRGVTGANHQNTKAPCQDASLAAVRYYKGYSYTLLAVADGHGSDRYTHSHIGAHFAVEAVSESATRWILSAVDCLEGGPRQWYENSRRSFEENFPRWLRENWLARVKRHAGEGAGDGCETAYGTTVALAIVFQGRVFAGAIGDSTILILRNTDSAEPDLFTDTMPTASLGLSTASLASADAVSRWTTRVMALDDARLIAAVTDGFTDSIADLRTTLRALRDRIQQHGVAWLWDKWPGFLERLTEDGVGDDIASVLYLPASAITTKAETQDGVMFEEAEAVLSDPPAMTHEEVDACDKDIMSNNADAQSVSEVPVQAHLQADQGGESQSLSIHPITYKPTETET